MHRIALLFVVVLVACQYDPFVHEFTTERPSATDLLGAYVLDDESVHMLRDAHVTIPTSSFIIRPDGTFTLSRVPSCWRAAYTCSSATEEVSGKWRLGKHQDWWSLQLTCTNIDGQSTEYGNVAMIRGDEPPYKLHFTVGDPDTGEALAFTKVRSAS
jgi:hypothetical protein